MRRLRVFFMTSTAKQSAADIYGSKKQYMHAELPIFITLYREVRICNSYKQEK